MPTPIRYTAPTSFTTVNAVADDAISAESPSVAAATCTSPPLATPHADARPARRPLSTLCVTMYVTAGPGTTASASDATQNSANADTEGSVTGSPGRGGGTAAGTRAAARSATRAG